MIHDQKIKRFFLLMFTQAVLLCPAPGSPGDKLSSQLSNSVQRIEDGEYSWLNQEYGVVTKWKNQRLYLSWLRSEYQDLNDLYIKSSFVKFRYERSLFSKSLNFSFGSHDLYNQAAGQKSKQGQILVPGWGGTSNYTLNGKNLLAGGVISIGYFHQIFEVYESDFSNFEEKAVRFRVTEPIVKKDGSWKFEEKNFRRSFFAGMNLVNKRAGINKKVNLFVLASDKGPGINNLSPVVANDSSGVANKPQREFIFYMDLALFSREKQNKKDLKFSPNRCGTFYPRKKESAKKTGKKERQNFRGSSSPKRFQSRINIMLPVSETGKPVNPAGFAFVHWLFLKSYFYKEPSFKNLTLNQESLYRLSRREEKRVKHYPDSRNVQSSFYDRKIPVSERGVIASADFYKAGSYSPFWLEYRKINFLDVEHRQYLGGIQISGIKKIFRQGSFGYRWTDFKNRDIQEKIMDMGFRMIFGFSSILAIDISGSYIYQGAQNPFPLAGAYNLRFSMEMRLHRRFKINGAYRLLRDMNGYPPFFYGMGERSFYWLTAEGINPWSLSGNFRDINLDLHIKLNGFGVSHWGKIIFYIHADVKF